MTKSKAAKTETVVVTDSLVVDKKTDPIAEVKEEKTAEEVLSEMTDEEKKLLKANYPISNLKFVEESGECRICGKKTNLKERILCYECYQEHESKIQ